MIDNALLDRITAKVLEHLSCPRVELEASGRHVHLCRGDVEALFGKGYNLTKVGDLSQPGQFVCKERLHVVGPKGAFDSVVILGPERAESQVEISLTDTMVLGVKAPVRLSGDIARTPGAKLVGPAGEVTLTQGVIVAKRHIHMTPQDAERFGLKDKDVLNVQVMGERGLTFGEVVLRVNKDFATYMHIDYDEANACCFKKGTMGMIIRPSPKD